MGDHGSVSGDVLFRINGGGASGRRVSAGRDRSGYRSVPAAGAAIRGTADGALSAGDPRWVFAARVASQLEGGRAGVLRPERRERLMRTARLLGLRAFDASLVIALVQDSARRGDMPAGYAPLSPGLGEALRSVPAVERARDGVLMRSASAGMLIGVLLAGLAIWWVQGG
jgi:hypothetical protein